MRECVYVRACVCMRACVCVRVCVCACVCMRVYVSVLQTGWWVGSFNNNNSDSPDGSAPSVS